MGAAYSTYCGTELRDTQYAGECRLVDGTTDPTPGGSRSLAASGIDATGASAVLNIGHWFTFAGTVLSHGAGSNNFTYERDSGGGGWKAAKYNPHADLYFLEGLLSLLDGIVIAQLGPWSSMTHTTARCSSSRLSISS